MCYTIHNGCGDVVGVSLADGTAANEYDYDVFGNIIKETELVANPYKYAGYYHDSETGYYYLRTRYYDPNTARFIAEDTFNGYYTDPLSLNKYTYVHNCPTIYHDPDGMAFTDVANLMNGWSKLKTLGKKVQAFAKGLEKPFAKRDPLNAVGKLTGSDVTFGQAVKSLAVAQLSKTKMGSKLVKTGLKLEANLQRTVEENQRAYKAGEYFTSKTLLALDVAQIGVGLGGAIGALSKLGASGGVVAPVIMGDGAAYNGFSQRQVGVYNRNLMCFGSVL